MSIEIGLNQFLDKKSYASQLIDTTRNQYERIIKEFAAIIAAKTFEEITVEAILSYKYFLYGKLEAKKHSDATVRNKVYAVASFLNFAYKSEMTAISGAAFLFMFDDLPRRPLPDKDLTEPILKLTVLDAIAAKGTRIRCMISVLLNGGLRVSEMVNLKVDDIYKKNDDWRLRVQMGKGRKRRSFKIPQELVGDVFAYKYTCNVEAGWLFPSKTNRGDHITRQTVWYQIKKMSQAVDTKLYPHLFRHLNGYLQRREKIPLEVIQQRLGHASIATTEIYTHPEMLEEKSPTIKLF